MARLESGNGWQSSRVSFSTDLSPTDIASPEKRKTSSKADMNYSKEFEFCSFSSCDADEIETLKSADKLFVDGKIMPQIRAPEVQILSSGTHASLESSSQVRSESFNVSQTSGDENDTWKSSPSPSSRWKKLFKLINNEDFFPAVKEPDQGLNDGENDAKNSLSGRLRWPFSRSGKQKRESSLFCALPFLSSRSAVEHESKPCSEASSYRSISLGAASGRKNFLSDSKIFGTASSKRENFKKPADLAKRKGNHERVVRTSPSRTYGRRSPGRRNERFTVRNSEGIASGMSMRVSPVVNIPAALGMTSFGGRKKGSGVFSAVSRNNGTPRKKGS